jgi:hypothetical protein
VAQSLDEIFGDSPSFGIPGIATTPDFDYFIWNAQSGDQVAVALTPEDVSMPEETQDVLALSGLTASDYVSPRTWLSLLPLARRPS